MHSKYINLLIKKFFEKSLPKEIQNKFRQWLITPDNVEEKESVLMDLWNSIPSQADDSTMQDLQLLHQRIDNPVTSKSKKVNIRYVIRIAAMIAVPLICSLLTYFLTQEYSVRSINMVERFVPYGEKKLII